MACKCMFVRVCVQDDNAAADVNEQVTIHTHALTFSPPYFVDMQINLLCVHACVHMYVRIANSRAHHHHHRHHHHR